MEGFPARNEFFFALGGEFPTEFAKSGGLASLPLARTEGRAGVGVVGWLVEELAIEFEMKFGVTGTKEGIVEIQMTSDAGVGATVEGVHIA